MVMTQNRGIPQKKARKKTRADRESHIETCRRMQQIAAGENFNRGPSLQRGAFARPVARRDKIGGGHVCPARLGRGIHCL
jgi:hypothetical protein